MRFSWMLLVSILCVLATGCGAQMSDFVHGVSKDRNGPAPRFPGSPVQLAPGASLVSSTRYEGHVSLTTTQKPLTGTRIDARVSLHQTRVQ